MVDAQLRDAAHHGIGDDVGGVQPPAKANLDNAGVSRMLGKGQKGCRCRHLEKARIHPFGNVQNTLQITRQRIVADQLSRHPDTFVEADQMGRRKDMDGLAIGFHRRAQEGAGRSLAVGARNVKDRRQSAVGIAQPLQQRGYPLQPQYIGAGG